MASKIKRKYVDSHWLIFAIQGIIALLFGWFVMFTGIEDLRTLIAIVGATLLGMSLVELFNVLHRHHHEHGWGFPLAIALIEAVVAIALLLTIDQNVAWHLGILAGYTLLRGVFEILIAFKSVDDPTDRFIWLVCGICGAIVAFVILNSGHFATTTFIKFFGSYMLIFGISNLVYGVYNRNEAAELKATAATHRKAKKSTNKKTTKTTKK